MKLAKLELYRIFINNKGILLVLLSLLLKVATLAVIPELKDDRIKLSQRQYNVYMDDLYGTDNDEKQLFIATEYNTAKTLVEKFGEMSAAYDHGEITEAEWSEFYALQDYYAIRLPALSILYEKLTDFQQIESYEGIERPAYFYDYGWRTVFTYLAIPDILCILSAAVLAVQVFGNDIAHGSVNLLRTTKNGRKRLFTFRVSFCALSAAAVALVHTAAEILMFALRMPLNDIAEPLYSLPHFAGLPIPISIQTGLIALYAFRVFGVVCVTLLALALTIFLRGIVNTLASTLTLILLPILLRGTMPPSVVPYTHTGFLIGEDVMRNYTFLPNALYWVLPACALLAITLALLWTAGWAFRKSAFPD